MASRSFRPVLTAFSAPCAALFADLHRRQTSSVRNEGLDDKAFEALKVLKNEAHTRDTRKITFQLPAHATRWTTKVPIANILVAADFKDPGADKVTQVAKPYNPLSLEEEGSVTILVKQYDNAKLGGKLHALKAGEAIAVKGGSQQWTYEPGKHTHYAMVAGGTGVTPLVQALQYILAHDSKTTKVTLFLANKTPEDVLLKSELATLEKAYPGRLHVHHHVDSQAGGVVTAEALRKVLPPAEPGVYVMVCGPMAMLKAVAGPKGKNWTQGELAGFLKELGFAEGQVWKV